VLARVPRRGPARTPYHSHCCRSSRNQSRSRHGDAVVQLGLNRQIVNHMQRKQRSKAGSIREFETFHLLQHNCSSRVDKVSPHQKNPATVRQVGDPWVRRPIRRSSRDNRQYAKNVPSHLTKMRLRQCGLRAFALATMSAITSVQEGKYSGVSWGSEIKPRWLEWSFSGQPER
jgi:hypothetical protein